MEESVKSLLMVDVDGVLNPSTPSDKYRKYKFTLSEGVFTVHLNPEHGQWLVNLAEETDCELVWCTMWQEYAPQLIAPILNLPEMPFVPIQSWKMDSSIGADKAHAAKKYANGRKFVALEDEYDFKDHLYDSDGYQVTVDYTTGLQRWHIEQARNRLLTE